MNLTLLQEAISEIKTELEASIRTATYNDKVYDNGQRAKEALIRSQNLILKIHEVVKVSLYDELSKHRIHFSIHPPLGQKSPEVTFHGFIKSKKQDIVVLFDDTSSVQGGIISEGPLTGTYDALGKPKSELSIVIGVRSQLSSVAKNFDTLMERTFAETLNLRLRLPSLVMGEVYLLPVVEYDDVAMGQSRVAWKSTPVPVERFIKTFIAISGRTAQSLKEELYKYERTALILVDFRESSPKIFLTTEQLKKEAYVSKDFTEHFELLSPSGFAEDIVRVHHERHIAHHPSRISFISSTDTPYRQAR